jgi:hypothetical protein
VRRPADLVFGVPREHARKNIVARTFSIVTTVGPTSLLARARRMAKENNATLLGDEGSGRFSHQRASGEYRMVGRTLIVS